MANKYLILLVEDESNIASFITTVLRANQYEVKRAATGEEALMMASSYCPDLIILDLGLPDIDGQKVLSTVRSWTQTPVIVVSARSHERDKVESLDLGADDYITKPFSPPVLLAHIAAVLKRYKRPEEISILQHRGVVLDLAKGCVEFQEQKVELTKNELKILHFLFLNADRIVSRVELIEYLWDNQVFIDDNTLSVNMTRIRAKLEEIGVHGVIKTKRGMGYCL